MEGLMELAAIWIERDMYVEEVDGQVVKTKRLHAGQHIRYGENYLSHVTEQSPANATIVSCRGDIHSTVLLIDLITNEFEVITMLIKDERNLFPKG